jgi:hypothetical protein
MHTTGRYVFRTHSEQRLVTRWAVPVVVATLLVLAGCAAPGDRTPASS